MPEHKDVKHTTRLSNLEWQLFTHSAVEERCMNEILWFSWSNNNVPLFIAVQGLKVLCLSKWKNCHYKEIHDGPMPTPTTLGYFIQQLFLLKEKAKSFFFLFQKNNVLHMLRIMQSFLQKLQPITASYHPHSVPWERESASNYQTTCPKLTTPHPNS